MNLPKDGAEFMVGFRVQHRGLTADGRGFICLGHYSEYGNRAVIARFLEMDS